jgi:hypothetical protein
MNDLPNLKLSYNTTNFSMAVDNVTDSAGLVVDAV